ncbi:hypothetical protein BH10PSE1_BH10PSE1_26630 [soil metagenome]
MADGALTLNLDDATARRLADAARQAGMTPEAYALERILADLTPPAHDWTEADRRLAEYDRTGEFIDAAEALDAFVASVDARAAARQ